MARFWKCLVGVGLAGVFASGSAVAAVQDLGDLFPTTSPGHVTKPLFGTTTPGTDFNDLYYFDVSGAAVVSESVISLIAPPLPVLPPENPDTFSISLDVLEWDGTQFTSLLFAPGQGSAISLNLPLSGAGGGGPFNRRFELRVFTDPSTPIPTGGADTSLSYGGSIAATTAVPEPSVALLAIGGMILIAFLGRRRSVHLA
jgi:hypothetical protein